ncbi:MAG TPA: Holliday junction resolvase RuvX [Phycisphaerae bacterium]|nr:Holliday junction resolvase RuvX [Phycisphaerae bacterium]HPS52806.1 Holliday junction resolvase RuvX [Phycisphaerae bacterium]
MPRYLGVDYGHKRVGLAVGDSADGFATPLCVLQGGDDESLVRKISDVCEEYDCRVVIVGLALNMDDTAGPAAMKTLEFAQKLCVGGLDVRMWDERLSSFDADMTLAGTMTRKKRKARQDAVAAASFLNDFLAGKNRQAAQTPQQVLNNVKKS